VTSDEQTGVHLGSVFEDLVDLGETNQADLAGATSDVQRPAYFLAELRLRSNGLTVHEPLSASMSADRPPSTVRTNAMKAARASSDPNT
jgi:hypothetical protein